MDTTISRSMLRIGRRAPRCHASGKVRYRTYKKALRFKERSTAMIQRRLYIYACPCCGDWHLTKSKPNGRGAA